MYVLVSFVPVEVVQTVGIPVRALDWARLGDLCEFHFAKLANFAISTLQMREYF